MLAYYCPLKIFKNWSLAENPIDFLSQFRALSVDAFYTPSCAFFIKHKLNFAEFFNQGDTEKSMKLEVSMMCDRETTNIASG